MAVSLRSNTRLRRTAYSSLQARLAQVGEPALLASSILVWIDLLPRTERVVRAKPENFCGLLVRILIAAKLNTGNRPPHRHRRIIGHERRPLLPDGNRFLGAPHYQIFSSYLD